MADFKKARAQIKGKAKSRFDKASGSAYAKVAGDPAAITALRNIDQRAADIKAKLRAHYKKHRESWVAREAIKIWRKGSNPAMHLRPKIFSTNRFDEKGIMRQARVNVHRRMAMRISAVNRTKSRMQNAVTRSTKKARESRNLQLGRDFSKANALSRKKARNL